MSFVHSLYNRFVVQGFLLNSLPKAGTNLLAKICCALPGIRTRYESLLHLDLPRLTGDRKPQNGDDAIPLGVTWPRPVPSGALRDALGEVGRGSLVSVHAPWSAGLVKLLNERAMKSVLIVRDPRDVVVSAARYISRSPEHLFHNLYRPLSFDDQLTLTIRGLEPSQAGEPRVLSIADACASLLPWFSEPLCRVTRFERLVGPQGGGCAGAQVEEIRSIADHLGLRTTPRARERIAATAFGGTRTFHAGKLGEWRSHFRPDHVRLFKEIAGGQLITMGYEQDDGW